MSFACKKKYSIDLWNRFNRDSCRNAFYVGKRYYEYFLSGLGL